LGSGAFGIIYLAEDVDQGNKRVAVKMEPLNSKHPQLLNEARILQSLQGKDRFPDFIWYGEEGDYNVLIMELLGPSLDDLYLYWDNQFTLKTCLMLFDQGIQCLESLHEKDIIHRDIKPDNFWIGVDDESENLKLLDFGLSRYYRDGVTKNHIEYCEGKGMIGTPRYWSINAHLGNELSRRDDLESLGYVIIHMLTSSLPWKGTKAANKKEKSDKILNIKLESIKSWILFDDLPREFKEYFDIVFKLKFNETPNYNKLRRLMKELFLNRGLDYNFDWQLSDMDRDNDLEVEHTKESSLINNQEVSAIQDSPNGPSEDAGFHN
jgi:serine/threonine protein kinase